MNYLQRHLQTLVEQEKIEQNMASMLEKMLGAKDIESIKMAETIISDAVKQIVYNDLSDEQKNTFDQMIDYIEDENKFDAIIINGYAGTGKTYLIRKFVSYLKIIYKKKIAITAPTNKAVKVLSEGNENAFIDENSQVLRGSVCYSTVHKLLNMKEVIDDFGNSKFIPFDGDNIASYDLIIVDEMSMVSTEISHYLIDAVKGKKKLILLGDKCQIPPVNESESLLFNYPGLITKTFVLDKIIRQKEGNPIIESSIKIRENISKPNPIENKVSEISENGSVIYINSEKEKNVTHETINKYLLSEEFKTDKKFFKMLAWRNNTVSYLNKHARKVLYNDTYGDNIPQYVIGECLVATKTIFDRVQTRYGFEMQQIISTSQELIVKDIRILDIIRTERLLTTNSDINTYYKYWCLTVEDENGKTHTVYKIHNDSAEQFRKLCFLLRSQCIRLKNSKCWAQYFNICRWDSAIDYGYAMSCHKSQGSTYKNVMLIDEDIALNRNLIERNKIRYTSYTRAANNLYVLWK